MKEIAVLPSFCKYTGLTYQGVKTLLNTASSLIVKKNKIK